MERHSRNRSGGWRDYLFYGTGVAKGTLSSVYLSNRKYQVSWKKPVSGKEISQRIRFRIIHLSDLISIRPFPPFSPESEGSGERVPGDRGSPEVSEKTFGVNIYSIKVTP